MSTSPRLRALLAVLALVVIGAAAVVTSDEVEAHRHRAEMLRLAAGCYRYSGSAVYPFAHFQLVGDLDPWAAHPSGSVGWRASDPRDSSQLIFWQWSMNGEDLVRVRAGNGFGDSYLEFIPAQGEMIGYRVDGSDAGPPFERDAGRGRVQRVSCADTLRADGRVGQLRHAIN